MGKTLLMKFKTNKDKTHSLKLNNVKDEVAEEDVKELMDNLVTHNVVLTAAGKLQTKESAELITTTSEPLDIE